MREHHNVYVIELDKDVLYEAKFKKANPDYRIGMPCVYVGMTGHDPDTRFDQHKAGIKSNRYAMKYGIRLMPEIYETLNPMPYGDAQYMEVDLAIRLRSLAKLTCISPIFRRRCDFRNNKASTFWTPPPLSAAQWKN